MRNAAVWLRRLLAHTLRFVPVSFDLARDFHDQMVLWFEGRGPEDDSDAIELSFVEALRDDIAILDATEQAFHGVQRRVTTIDRGGEPGAIQERDIALRVFEGDEVYLNPSTNRDSGEFADVRVVGSKNVIVIQRRSRRFTCPNGLRDS